MAYLTLDEDKKIILQKFRNNMSDLLEPHHDDPFLLRWLRAREFNLQHAEKMLREDFKFRKMMKSDTVVRDYQPPEVVLQYLPSEFLGFSKKGHAVRFFDIGHFDCKGFTRSLTPHDTLKNFIWLFEMDYSKLQENNRKTGRYEEKNIYIAEYSKLKLSQWVDKAAIRRIIQTAQFYQDHYPESLYRVYGINAPNFIVYLINVILKPFLPDNVRKKIQFYGAGDESYKEELFSFVPKEIVPAYLGGTLYVPEGDPTCGGLIHRKEKIPSSYFLSEQVGLNPGDPQVQQKTIHERSFFEVKQQIEVPGAILLWQFQTKDYNIKFGLFYREKPISSTKKGMDNDLEELLPVGNTDSNVVIEHGEYICEKTGTYILHFDNTNSWWRSKHLLYKVEVQNPEGELVI